MLFILNLMGSFKSGSNNKSHPVSVTFIINDKSGSPRAPKQELVINAKIFFGGRVHNEFLLDGERATTGR